MAQFGFFDADKWLCSQSAKGYPLEIIKRTVAWEEFRAGIGGR
jgi:hypothetical protein